MHVPRQGCGQGLGDNAVWVTAILWYHSYYHLPNGRAMPWTQHPLQRPTYLALVDDATWHWRWTKRSHEKMNLVLLLLLFRHDFLEN